jgi:hypothetical protein
VIAGAALGGVLIALVAAATAVSTGREIVNVDPWLSSLDTVKSPPISRQNRQQIASPRPAPPYMRAFRLSLCANGWNSCGSWSGAMPMPVSVTSKMTQCCVDASVLGGGNSVLKTDNSELTHSVIVPCSVNLAALASS